LRCASSAFGTQSENAVLQRRFRLAGSVAPATTQAAVATVDPHVAGGAHLFVQFACAQCHGPQGQGGVSPAVPALTQAGKQLTAPQLRKIINHGLGESANPTQPYMPVWGAVISNTQVNDLVAYIRAGLPSVPTATPPQVPQGQEAAVEGATLYLTYGCINCHGQTASAASPIPSRQTRRSLPSQESPSASSSTRTPRSKPSSAAAA
jgi:mono/diheme cytochrome c family protein